MDDERADLERRRTEYAARAEESLRLSTETTDENVRESFEAMARTWRDLAKQVDRKLANETSL
jgi:hypothetical protein